MSTNHNSPARARVLILDDDEEIALALQAVIQFHGHDTRVAHDLDAARSELASRAPDVFIVDLFIGAQRSDGLLAAVRETLPSVRCVLISASDRSTWNHLVEQGFVETALTKPFDSDALIALVEREVDGRRGAGR